MRNRKAISAWMMVLGLMASLAPVANAQAQTVPPKPAAAAAPLSVQAGQEWWRNAVIYEVYPRSFQDSNGDGLGDLNGIASRLDYLKQLGVDAIWITPCFPSPQVDFGYDISDYEQIDSQYGTLADFDRLIAEANKRGIRVLLDMVMNHTSDRHKWFLESRKSKSNPYRDWFVWRDGQGQTATSQGSAPNNWQSAFGHSAWQWDETTRQYYYHKFYVEQPDLNWDNPKVNEAFRQTLDFWLKRGVAGFRFDAIGSLFEDPGFADAAVVRDANGQPVIDEFGEARVERDKTDNLPGVHTVMQQMRAHTDRYAKSGFPGERLLVGETFARNPKELEALYGSAGHPEFQLPMDMQLASIDKLDVAGFRVHLEQVTTQIGANTPLFVFDNHDKPRLDARFGDGVHNVEIQRALAAVLFLSRGAALMYYGDEIGMVTTPPTRKEDVRDPVGITGWPKEKGRDGERTPMQWTGGTNAGFSTAAQTWLPVPPSASMVNVEAQENEKNSLLNWFRQVIALKKSHPAFTGSTAMLDRENSNVLSWQRRSADGRVAVVAVNFTAAPQTVKLSVPGASGKLTTLLATPGAKLPASLNQIELGPYGVFAGEVR